MEETAMRILILLILGLLPEAVGAQRIEPLGPIGPDGGFVRELHIAPGRHASLYAVAGTRVFRSRDGGESWKAITPGTPTFYRPTLFLPRWVDSGDYDSEHLFLVDGGLVLESSDGGDHWRTYFSNPDYRIIFIDADDPAYLVAHDARLYVTNSLLLSRNGGASWIDISNSINADGHYMQASVNPFNREHLVVTVSCCDTASFVTFDAGTSWERASKPPGGIQELKLVHDPSKLPVVYWLTSERLLKSHDGGLTWHDIGSVLIHTDTSRLTVSSLRPDVGDFFLNDHQPGYLYYTEGAVHEFIRGRAFYTSSDYGISWTPAQVPPDSAGLYDLVAVPDHPATLIASTGTNRLVLSKDHGRTWRALSDPLFVTLHDLDFVPPHALVAGTLGDGVWRFDLAGALPVSPGPARAPAEAVTLDVFPNPSPGRVTIQFDLAIASVVHLVIYDTRGRRMQSLMDGLWMAPGIHRVTWDGTDAAGRPVASGWYVARLVAGSARVVHPLLLVK